MPQARNNKSRRSQPAPAAGQSALLQFLEKLDEDTFCQTLLPMLIENESAGDLAATCSQLRQLCHSSIKKLDLRALLRDDVQPSDAEQWTQHLQEHFPQCSSVVLQVEDSESYQALNYMLPALARLPDLTGLTVEVDGPPLAEMLPMAMLLRSLRTQLASLCSLSLTVSQSWTGAGLAWAELAAMTQLTRLSIANTCKDGTLCDKADLLQLSVLCDLKELSITLENTEPDQNPVCLQLVSQMTALTSLQLSACNADGIESLRNCTGLQTLVLPYHVGVSFELPVSGWSVLGELTQLTELTLWPVKQRSNCEGCMSALQQLTGLHLVNFEKWAPYVLMGLQGLSQLTSVGGGWSAGDGSAVDVILPQVQQLWASEDHIPCSAFPNLLHINLFAAIPSAVLTALSRHCCCLQSIKLTCLPEASGGARRTLYSAEPVADRVAAVMSLSNLHHLTALDFSVADNAELLALAHSTAVLARQHKLAELRLVVPEESEVSSSGLICLGQLSGIDVLHVWLLKPALMQPPEMAQVFVATLAGVNELQLFVDVEEQQISLTNALDHAESCGLPLAPVHSVSLED